MTISAPPIGGLDEFGAGSPGLSGSSMSVILSSISVIGLRRLCRDDVVGASRHRIPAHRAGPDARGRPLQLQTRAGGALAGGLECPVHPGVSLPHGRAELGSEPVQRFHLLGHQPVASLITLLSSLPFLIAFSAASITCAGVKVPASPFCPAQMFSCSSVLRVFLAPFTPSSSAAGPTTIILPTSAIVIETGVSGTGGATSFPG